MPLKNNINKLNAPLRRDKSKRSKSNTKMNNTIIKTKIKKKMSNTNTSNNKQAPVNKKEPNDIRIGQNSRVRNVVRYCNSLLKEKTYKTLHFSAVGGAIGKLVSAVEVLKTVNEGLYQQNKLATVSYQSSDSKEVQNNQKLYPKMEVILSLEDFKDKTDGYQNKLDETERQKLYKLFNEQPIRRGRRGGFKGKIMDYIKEKHPDLYPLYEEIYNKKDRNYFERLEKEAEMLAKENDCPFVDNETPYGRAKQGHPVIVDYFYHEEVRGTNNTGKRNKN